MEPTLWERIGAATVKVLLAALPSLVKLLWDHWPKTPPERRNDKPGTGS